MDDAENLAKLLGHLAPEKFRAFMASEFSLALPDLDSKALLKTQREAITAHLCGLDIVERQKIEEVAEKIVELTDGSGQDVLEGLCESEFDDAEKAAFKKLSNQYERALWLYQNNQKLFKTALDAREADICRQNPRCYSGFVAPKKLAILMDSATENHFHDKVSEQFDCPKESIAIQIFTRVRPDSQTGADVELYQISIHHNRPPEIVDCVRDSELVSQELIRSVSSHITYEPKNGHLEVLSHEVEDGRKALARLMADTLLQSPISGEKIPLKQYDYQSLAAPRTFDIASENVAFVKVTELGYVQGHRTLIVRIWANDTEDIYTASRSMIGEAFDFRSYTLTYAKLSIRLKKIGKERQRTITVVLRDGNRCNIKNKREKDRSLCDRLLAKWGLVKEIGHDIAKPVEAVAA